MPSVPLRPPSRGVLAHRAASLRLAALAFTALLTLVALTPFGVTTANAAATPANHDESRVPPYSLPDPLRFESGAGPVSSAAAWFDRRRPELLELFAREVYGRPLPPPTSPRWRVLAEDRSALDGRATRREVALHLDDSDASRVLRFVVFVPHQAPKPAPVFVGLHLFDTAKPHPEPAVARRLRNAPAAPANPAPAPGQVGRDTADRILSRGYALASLNLDDLSPDSRTNWWRGLLRLSGRATDGPPGPGETGALGLWAWGLGRTIDYAAASPDLDPRRVIAIGHSRMGKAALWAGAIDDRFAAVISNDSGCGGAALSKRIFGETVEIITRAFPHWFTGNFVRYAGREADLPVDQHQLLALIAPRPLYVASAEDDAWADPRGEFLAAWHAAPVYRLLGAPALDPASSNQPPVDVPVGEVLRYHVRQGQHDLTDFDWNRYLDFADRHVRGSAAAAAGSSASAAASGAPAVALPGSGTDEAARGRRPNWTALLRQPESWFGSSTGRAVTAAILAHQTPLGDWPKNTNTTLAPAPGPVPAAPGRTEARPRGTFDNGATVSELRFLARAFTVTAEPAASNAVVRGVRHVLDAQLPSGGWPQSHPPGSGYARHITFNDDTMVHLMELARDVAARPEFAFLGPGLRDRARLAFDRGLQCILRCQVRVDGRLTVWGAQHDAVTLAPAAARTFEPASLAAAESSRVVQLLLSLEPPPPGVPEAVRAAAAWFDATRLDGLRQVREDGDKKVVPDPAAPPLWARFYEIGSNRPLFCGRDGVVKYRLADIELERRTGYAWYGDWGTAVAREFARWQAAHPRP